MYVYMYMYMYTESVYHSLTKLSPHLQWMTKGTSNLFLSSWILSSILKTGSGEDGFPWSGQAA